MSNIEKSSADFYDTAKEIWKTVVHRDAPKSFELELRLEFHKRLLNIFQVGGYYYFVFNIPKLEFEFMSKGVTKILGYSPEEITLSFFLDLIHPDDKPYFLDFESKIAAFFKSLPYDKVKKYKTQYDIRVRAKNNKYIRILQQAVQVEYDEANFYRTFDLQTDISHIKQEGTPCFSIIGLDGEPSYYNIQDDTETFTKSYDLFTRRERDILKRIIEGRNSKEIAEELYISLHTVNAHRKNILFKADCKSPVELVIKSIHEGWV